MSAQNAQTIAQAKLGIAHFKLGIARREGSELNPKIPPRKYDIDGGVMHVPFHSPTFERYIRPHWESLFEHEDSDHEEGNTQQAAYQGKSAAVSISRMARTAFLECEECIQAVNIMAVEIANSPVSACHGEVVTAE